jgi:hypothetical protein
MPKDLEKTKIHKDVELIAVKAQQSFSTQKNEMKLNLQYDAGKLLLVFLANFNFSFNC